MTIYGIDASNHQGNQSSLGGVAAKFYCHKLTEGTSYTDPYAAHNLAWAKSVGITLRGGYHFIRAGAGAAQADFFIARARALFGQDLRGNLWQLDCESDASLADIKAFKARWDSETGSVPIFFYTGDWWLQPRGFNVASLGFAGLWSAPTRGYVGAAGNVTAADWTANYGGFGRLAIVQYDARSSIGDVNQYQGTLAQLKALCTGSEDEDDMPSVEQVWKTDNMVAAPKDSASYATNKGWTAGNALAEAVRAARSAEQHAAANTAAIKVLATAQGLDPDKVYAAVEAGSKAAVAEALKAGAQG